MSFINFNKREDHSAEYSVEMIKEALLAVESKNINKVNSLVEGLAGNIKLNEALNLFSNKIDGMSALDVAKLNNMDQIIEAKANLVEIKVGGKKIKVDINTIEIDGIDTRDYPDFVDAFFSYAEDYRGRELTDDELDVLTDEHADLINELIFDQQLYAGLIIAEGKSINKIQKEWAEVTADMASTVKTWKTAEGETKTQLLDKLKALNIRKKELDGELEIAVMGKDRNVELSGAFEAFSRMSSDVVGNELYDAAQKLSDYYDWLKAGNDSGKGETLDEVISLLKKCKKSIKRFDKPEEVKGTAFESFVTEKIKVKDIENTWNSMYGEDFKDEYAGVYDEIIRKYKGKVTKDELAKLWDKMYGEVMQDEYSGFFDSLDESVVTEAKFVKEFDEAVLKATTQEEVLEIYPNAEFFTGKSDHFFGELDGNLFFKAYYTKAQKEFEIKSVYSQKGSNYVHLYNESVVTEAKSFSESELKSAAQSVADALAKVNKTKAEVINFKTLDKDGKIAGFYIHKATNKEGAPSRYWITDSGEVVSAFRHDTFGDGVVAQVGDKLASVVKTFKANESVVTEGNAFLGARAKAIEEDKEEFEFNGKTYKVTTKVNEGAVKRFEYDFNQMVKDIKRGYGWIAPEYVADTWENSSDSIDFEIVKGELYRRLIDLNLLAYANDDNPEEPGEYVKSLKSLNVKELVAEKKLTWESLKEKIKI